ncbi:MAG: hypothetical protein Tsb009_12200 [Planctomycetaceae bacterium]
MERGTQEMEHLRRIVDQKWQSPEYTVLHIPVIMFNNIFNVLTAAISRGFDLSRNFTKSDGS